jgi:predicted DsbA family dithiol-disulfide isomerase
MLIEVYSDVVCPWCYIGKHRLMRALNERPHLNPEIRWMPFQLNPDMPAGGLDRTAYVNLKFGSRERALQVQAMLEQTATRDGLPINLKAIQRSPNTVDAHRLIRLASREGLADLMVDAMFNAYFVEGLDLGDRRILADLAEAIGMSGKEAARFLASDEEAAAVRSSDIAARRLGIHAVPCFIINKHYAIAGAHEPETFAPLFDLAMIDTMASRQEAAALSQ